MEQCSFHLVSYLYHPTHSQIIFVYYPTYRQLLFVYYLSPHMRGVIRSEETSSLGTLGLVSKEVLLGSLGYGLPDCHVVPGSYAGIVDYESPHMRGVIRSQETKSYGTLGLVSEGVPHEDQESWSVMWYQDHMQVQQQNTLEIPSLVGGDPDRGFLHIGVITEDGVLGFGIKGCPAGRPGVMVSHVVPEYVGNSTLSILSFERGNQGLGDQELGGLGLVPKVVQQKELDL